MGAKTGEPDIAYGADLPAPLLASLIASATAAATVSSASSSTSATASPTPRACKAADTGSPTDSTLASTPASTPVSSPDATPSVSRSSSRSSSPFRHYTSPPDGGTAAAAGTSASASSAGSSGSSGSSGGSGSSGQAGSKRFPHYKAPSVESYPVLVQMCEHCLDADDSPGLAAIARSRGLPAQLRSRAWPLLLQTHPHVTTPQLVPAAEGAVDIQEPPVKRVKGDITRLLARVLRTRRWQGSAPASLAGSSSSTPHGSPPSLVNSPCDEHLPTSDKAPDAAVVESIERSVLQFVRKYGSSAPYERGMVWVAYTLSQAMGGVPLDPQVFEHAMLVFLHTDEARQADSLSQTVSFFLAQIRAQLPALGQHFDQECMLGFLADEEWLLWWLKWFGARAFSVDNAARLWDCYFGYRKLCGLDILEPRKQHVFCCLSVLNAIQFRLLELDQSEMRQMLLHLPPSDMELVVARAEDVANRVRERAAELEEESCSDSLSRSNSSSTSH